MEHLRLENKSAELEEICERHGVMRLDLFGSAVENAFDSEKSDLDFVVSFVPQTPPSLFDRYFGLREDLALLFGRKVDLVMENAIKNLYFAKSVDESRTLLYAA